MLQKKILIAVGIVLILLLAGVPFVVGISDYRGGYYIQSDKITQSTDKCEVFRLEVHADEDRHSVSTNEAQGGTFDLRPICQGSGNYSVIVSASCRDGQSFTSVGESPYGSFIYAQCPRHFHWDAGGHRQYLYLTYACCPYDEPPDSTATDDCDFRVGAPNDDIPYNCPDVVNNQTNRDLGWVFPATYAYQALDCHPEDDTLKNNPVEPETANDEITQSTAVGIGYKPCTDGIDNDCDGEIDELEECEADVKESLCTGVDPALTGYDWKSPSLNSAFQGQACCGDDISYSGSDCGRVISNNICTDSGWKSPNNDDLGQILEDGCYGKIVMSASNIYKCQPQLSPRTFTLNLTKEKADAPVFYTHTLYKQFKVYEGLNKLGLLSTSTALDADAYTISSNDPEVKITFSPSTQDVEGRLTTLEADSQFSTRALNSSLTITSSGIYAFYFPNVPESFETVSITKDIGVITKNEQTHDYVCYEEDPDRVDETRAIVECAGKTGPDLNQFSFSYANLGVRQNSSLLFEETFTDTTSTGATSLAQQGITSQYGIDFVDGLTEIASDPGVKIEEPESRLIYPATGNIDYKEGTIEFWVKPLWNSTTDTRERVFFNYQETPYSYLRISKLADGRIECKIEVPAKTMLEQPLKAHIANNLEAGKWYKIGMSWNRSIVACSLSTIDGLITKQTATGYQPRFPKASTFTLGMVLGNTGLVAGAVFDNLKIYRNYKPTAYYCTDDFRWQEDLDDIKYKTACKAASGLKWTGNYCCGEPKDMPEYYTDSGTAPDERGGCWQSRWMDWGAIPIETGADKGPVINYKGQFEGCKAGNEILAIKDDFTNNLLVHDNPQCTLLINTSHITHDTDFYCSVNGNWTLATNDYLESQGQGATTEEQRTLKTFPWPAGNLTSQECCAQNDCWSGEQCIRNQRYDASYTIYNGYRCLDGNWIRQSPKITWNRQNRGFCPDQSQCLVNPWGDSANNDNPAAYFTNNPLEQPQCIWDKQYIKQYYCENGIWSTRTKLIALQLIELASPRGDYELFCGGFDDVLTYLGYTAIEGAGVVQDYVTNCGTNIPCANQFCAVKYADGVAFGTSLNVPVNDSVKSFVKFALGKSLNLCNQAMNNDGDYDLCGENIYYNNNTESIIRIPGGALPQATTDQLLQNRNFEIQNRFDNIKNYITPIFDNYGNEVVNTTTLFGNIFLAKKGSRDFFAYFEEGTYYNTLPGDYIGLVYNNLIMSDDPCGINYINQKTGAFGISCSYTNNNLNFVGVYPRTPVPGEPTIKQLWRGLTSLLRIS